MENLNASGFIATYYIGWPCSGEEWFVRKWVAAMRCLARELGLRITGASLMPEEIGTKLPRRIWLHCVPITQ